MDSISQAALGAAIGIATMGRRTPAWKSALAGAVVGTLPDLDVFIDYGDAVSNMTMHRGATHALFWLTLAAPFVAGPIAWIAGQRALFRRWWLAVWLALVTHPLLDAMTIYGTQLLQPFSAEPFGVGSMFIIDPLYTLPLLVGIGLALALRPVRGLRANAVGLALSCAYLAWSVAAQGWVERLVRDQLAAQPAAAEPVQRVLVTPAPFTTLLWRVVVMREHGYDEGFVSLLDDARPIDFSRHPRHPDLYDALRAHPPVARIAWFSRGFFAMGERDGVVTITDLRMGQHPYYAFSFAVADASNPHPVPARPRAVGGREGLDRGEALAWLQRRMLGERVRPPR